MRIDYDFDEIAEGPVPAMISGMDAAFRRLPYGGFDSRSGFVLFRADQRLNNAGGARFAPGCRRPDPRFYQVEAPYSGAVRPETFGDASTGKAVKPRAADKMGSEKPLHHIRSFNHAVPMKQSATPFWKSHAFVLICATGIVFLSYGSRQSFGVYLKPMSESFGWGRESLSLVFGTQALIYGLSAPFVGAIADRWGAIKVLCTAGVLYSAGVLLMANSLTPAGMLLSAGLLGGVGSAGCALSLVLSVASRVATDERRTLWLGIVTSGGTGGQLVLVPAGSMILQAYGWYPALIALGLLALLIVPLALLIRQAGGDALNSRKDGQSLSQALLEARSHRGYWLLVLGFFTCGFQIQFINNHLIAYLTDMHMNPLIGATAIAVIGLFNMIGTWISGWLGDRYRKKNLLAMLYMARSLIFMIFILAPLSPASVYIFSAAIGLLWLATVPLTSGIVYGMFGPRYMATLYGIVFLSHQVGSFTSVWLGGKIWDMTGSYDIAWWIVIIGGALASLLHWPIDERPVAEILAGRAVAST